MERLRLRFLTLVAVVSMPLVSSGAVEEIPVWEPIPKVNGSQHLLVIFQETEFIRSRIGEWLPKAFYEAAEEDEIYYRVDKVTRDDLAVTIQLSLKNKTSGESSGLSWQWTLPTGMGEIEVVSVGSGVIEVRYPETKEIREIRLARVGDISEAQKKFQISKAAPMWKWQLSSW